MSAVTRVWVTGRVAGGIRYFEVDCPIVAAAVPVLVAAGAAMPEPGAEAKNLPFSYSDLQALIMKLQ